VRLFTLKILCFVRVAVYQRPDCYWSIIGHQYQLSELPVKLGTMPICFLCKLNTKYCCCVLVTQSRKKTLSCISSIMTVEFIDIRGSTCSNANFLPAYDLSLS